MKTGISDKQWAILTKMFEAEEDTQETHEDHFLDQFVEAYHTEQMQHKLEDKMEAIANDMADNGYTQQKQAAFDHAAGHLYRLAGLARS